MSNYQILYWGLAIIAFLFVLDERNMYKQLYLDWKKRSRELERGKESEEQG